MLDFEDDLLLEEVDPEHRKKMIKKAQNNAKIKQARTEEELWKRTMPKEYRKYSYQEKIFEKQVGKIGIKNINNFIEDNGSYTFLVLRGTIGTGKTTLACSLGTELITQYDDFKSAAYISANSLCYKLSSWDAFSGEEDPVKRYSEVDLLVIDDVGAGNDSLTPAQEKKMNDIIDYRWSNSKSTMITTNMAIRGDAHGNGLVEWFGPSAWDRIQHRCLIVEFKGESRRTS